MNATLDMFLLLRRALVRHNFPKRNGVMIEQRARAYPDPTAWPVGNETDKSGEGPCMGVGGIRVSLQQSATEPGATGSVGALVQPKRVACVHGSAGTNGNDSLKTGGRKGEVKERQAWPRRVSSSGKQTRGHVLLTSSTECRVLPAPWML